MQVTKIVVHDRGAPVDPPKADEAKADEKPAPKPDDKAAAKASA